MMHILHEDQLIVGIDEAGRGPLAGPVIAAAVILNPNRPIVGLADSKQLTEQKRETLFSEIRRQSYAWAIGVGSVREIDQVNILQATFLAMQRAVERLKISPCLALIDGNMAPKLNCPSKTIIKGDESEPVISAASIVAKVLRDRLMKKLDKKYPDYGFAKHKGYGTELHLKKLKELGPCRIHRKFFAPVAALIEKVAV